MMNGLMSVPTLASAILPHDKASTSIFYENKRDCDSNKKELRVWSLNFTPVEHL
jgi:hypothetical protein